MVVFDHGTNYSYLLSIHNTNSAVQIPAFGSKGVRNCLWSIHPIHGFSLFCQYYSHPIYITTGLVPLVIIEYFLCPEDNSLIVLQFFDCIGSTLASEPCSELLTRDASCSPKCRSRFLRKTAPFFVMGRCWSFRINTLAHEMLRLGSRPRLAKAIAPLISERRTSEDKKLRTRFSQVVSDKTTSGNGRGLIQNRLNVTGIKGITKRHLGMKLMTTGSL